MEINNKFKILFTAAAFMIILALSGCLTGNDESAGNSDGVTEPQPDTGIQGDSDRSGNFAGHSGDGSGRNPNMAFRERNNRSMNGTGNFTGNFTSPERGNFTGNFTRPERGNFTGNFTRPERGSV